MNERRVRAYMPHRTLQKDGSVIEGFAEREVVDALHGPTGNKEPLICVSGASSAGSAGSTTDSPELGFDTRSSVRATLGDEASSGSDSPASPSTTMSELSGMGDGTVVGTLKGFGERGWDNSAESADRLVVSISSAAVSPAKTSASPDDAPGSRPESDPASSSSSLEQPMSLFNPEGMSSLRTFPDFFPRRVDEISRSFSRRWPSSGFTTSPGESWTADISECPSDGAGCSSSLADVLEETVAPRYFLSPRAAAGILRRAEKRDRELPSHLLAALEAVARMTTTPKADG